MAVTCDSCGTGRHVRRAFITLWNGNVVDLCRVCMEPLVKIIDGIGLAAAQRDEAARAAPPGNPGAGPAPGSV
jgi:hypothetical protein